MKKTLFFDLETHSADARLDMPPEEFVRIMQYAWGRDGEVVLTTDYDEIVEIVRSAELVIAHNGLNFDLPALFGRTPEATQMALDGRVLDTMIWAHMVNPAPYKYTMRSGRTVYDAAAPKNVKQWLSLDNQAFQFGIPGKIGDLRELAKKYNPPKTLVKALDYSLIPLDDPDFVEYAIQDVKVLQGLSVKLLERTRDMEYPWEVIYREMAITGCTSQITTNGMRIDTEVAVARVEELRRERDETMGWLVKAFDFPTEGKQPWKSDKGKEAIGRALAVYDINIKGKDWSKTPTGAPQFGGEVMLAQTEGTEAERLGRALATLQGQRSLAQLALESTHPDGYAHPDIVPFQRSARWSVTKPGVTVWTARGDNAIEKRYFIASEGRKLVAFDYSNADARVVAAYSGDYAYAERFRLDENGNPRDGHELNGRAGFGDEVYDSDPKKYRQDAKILGHGWNYGGRAKTLSTQTGLPLEAAKTFVNNMDRAFSWLVAWQNRVREEGKSGWVTNDWGRRLPVEIDRYYTQAPANLGQNGTREILADGLLKIARQNIEVLTWAICIIHDEVLFDIPVEHLDWAVPFIKENMETTFHPKDGLAQEIEFTVEHGKPADNWFEAVH